MCHWTTKTTWNILFRDRWFKEGRGSHRVQFSTQSSRNVTFPSDYSKPQLLANSLDIISSTSGTKFWHIALPFQPVNLISSITPESAGTWDKINRPQDARNRGAISIIWATLGNLQQTITENCFTQPTFLEMEFIHYRSWDGKWDLWIWVNKWGEYYVQLCQLV